MITPAQRIHIIENSLGCFVCGWCSLIPIVGLPMFVLALIRFQKARISSAGEWNPARRYSNWGMILATIGGFVSAVLFAVMTIIVLGNTD